MGFATYVATTLLDEGAWGTPTGEVPVGLGMMVETQVVGTQEDMVTTVAAGVLAGGAGAGAELLGTTTGALLDQLEEPVGTGATAGVVEAGALVAAMDEAGQLVTSGPQEVMVTSSVE